MKYSSIACVVIFSIAMQGKDRTPNAIGYMASTVIDGFEKLVTHGGTVWEELGKGQANAVLDKVSDDTVKLAVDKNALRAYLSQHKGNNTDAVHHEINDRSDKIKHDAQDIQTNLMQFGVEIDKAAHPIGAEMREAVLRAETMKMIEIDIVSDAWDAGKPEMAIQKLDAAIGHLRQMQKGILCLQNSIKAGKAACDKELKPMD